MAVTFRRRIDNLMLRWQARLNSEWADRVLPLACTGGLFLLLMLLALAKSRSLDGTPDLAAYSQAAHLINEGVDPTVTVTFDAHVLSQQAAFIFYPIALLTRILPAQPTLLVVQSAALALAIIPIWMICRRLANLRVGATLTVVFAYAVYPTMHNLNLAGFHPETIALPALLAAMYFGLGKRWWPFGLCCAVAVLARADLGLAVAGLGGLLFVEKSRRPGIITMASGAGWTLLCGAFIQPRLGADTYAHLNAFTEFGTSPLSVAWGMLTHPLSVLDQLTTEQNFNLLIVLLAPVLFLPVLAPRYLVPVLPLQALYMVADVPRDAVFGQQTVAATAFIFLATAFALARMGRKGVDQVTVDRRILGALLLASAVFFIQSAASSPYRHPWEWGGRDVVDQARVQVADQLGPDVAVRASPSMLTLLDERKTLYQLKSADRPDPAGAGEGVDAVVVDNRQVGDWSAVEQQVFRQGLESSGFTRTYDRQGIQLYVRKP